MFGSHTRRLVIASSVTVGSAAALFLSKDVMFAANYSTVYESGVQPIPTRKELLERLVEAKTEEGQFDILVIGGGATGSGATLDAVSRGLKVACIEREDFAAGTSSRSTKLIHGGVRYLEKAFTQLEPGQLLLVLDALHERKVFMDNVPHLTNSLPIITPCFSWWEIPYYWAGLKAYDMLALGRRLYPSYFLSRKEALRQFPMMKTEGLKGAVVYYDGQMDDARVNVSLAVTAATLGATTLNHMAVENLIKDINGTVVGVEARDRITGKLYPVRTKCVINACGPFVDAICKMDDPEHRNLIIPAQGTHIILPSFYSPNNMGLIVPKTKDGRVVFMLPWLDHTIAGTTDEQVELTYHPYAREHEEAFILSALSDYLRVNVRPEDVMATWAGIRPLALDPTKKDTQSLSRDHVIVEAPSGLVTITGGKWTTYRKMAQDVIDVVVKSRAMVTKGECITEHLKLVGADSWDEAMFTQLSQNYMRTKVARGKTSVANLPADVALHLSKAYGTRAFRVAELAQEAYGKRIAHGHPYLEAEVIYAVRYEMAQTAVDVLARRTRLAFLDSHSARKAAVRVVELMSSELGWSRSRRHQEMAEIEEYMKTMTLTVPSSSKK